MAAAMPSELPSHDEATGDGIEIVTFGCRLNIHESQVMRDHARAAGLADIVIVNTCAVTAEASRQARQAIRRLGRERPDARIVVTGCAAQIEPERFAAMAEVTQVVGNDSKLRAGTWQALAGDGRNERILVEDIMQVRQTAPHLVDGFTGRTRAFVQVQNGCDHRCTFCIIPFGRGNSRSVPMGAAVDQVRRVVESGAREVVVTGVDMTGYGRDLPGEPSLGTLIAAILRHVPELERLRLSSIDSVEADEGLVECFASEPRLMPHLHLSLQSGDDMILKRMKRRHSRSHAIAFCERIRRLRPDIVFGADIIAGFPTETEAMFARSLDIVEECGLTHLHVFPFSPRPGTPAARMPQLAGPVIRERAARLRAAGDSAWRRHLDGEIGAVRHVLVENGGLGRTEGFTTMHMPRDSARGDLIRMRVTGHDGRHLTGIPEAKLPRPEARTGAGDSACAMV
jgi:threonylcarbamoyladenosine tRNA methylthiotransferase MtaB